VYLLVDTKRNLPWRKVSLFSWDLYLYSQLKKFAAQLEPLLHAVSFAGETMYIQTLLKHKGKEVYGNYLRRNLDLP